MTLRLDPTATAVLVVDMQNDFCHEDGFYARTGKDIGGLAEPIPAVSNLLAAARRTGARVIYTRIVRHPVTGAIEHHHRLLPKRWFSHGDRLMAGTWGAEIVDALAPDATEAVIDKHGYSAFHKTDLEARLRQAGVRTLVLCGVVTYACVLATAFAAFDRGFDVILADDAAGSWDQQLGRSTNEIVDLLLGHTVPVSDIVFEGAA
jgi:nicotinamidase-related amidase